MSSNTYENYLTKEWGISPEVLSLVNACEKRLSARFEELDENLAVNQLKVLQAMQENNLSDSHFAWNTGYGYDDAGRETVERIFASVFHTEAALVRPNLVNGTHALAATLFGLLKPGEELIYVTGTPYDTLRTVIGREGEEYKGTLRDYGIAFREVALNDEGDVDLDAIRSAISDQTRVVAIQRSTGYAWRPAVTIERIREIAALVHEIRSDLIVMVDNCYGEFVDILEPTDVGADIIAGSLIKNPGGGLALTGGYVCGPEKLIERISYRLTCPGIGAECGLTFGQNRTVLQGLFLAPKVTNAALKGAMLCGEVYSSLGFEVCPSVDIERSDIVEAIKFNHPDLCIGFCQAIQSVSPVESFVTPIPWDMPGYQDQVIMASGSFVQGSSIEISADAPLRPPYIAYYQGGLTYEHARFGITKSLQVLVNRELIDAKTFKE